ncbi:MULTISPECIES: hypothetical protein [unclassified Mucilaginibacter]|uniref:hypothetical protein n=1 Tax=unclassified Mucilaginibacter TaxID=2617802 RepID=UPI0033970B40
MFADNTNALTGIALVGSSGNPGYVIRNTSTEYLRISGNGNVSIGTIDPNGCKFAVNGSAIATTMIVKLNSAWPEYVFKTV